MKKAEEKKPQPPVVPAVPVASHSTLPTVIDNTSKGAYIVMDDKGDQKIIDFGDEKVSDGKLCMYVNFRLGLDMSKM